MVRQNKVVSLRIKVQEAIDQQRIGAPKFLRCIVRTNNREHLEEKLAELLPLGEAWFGTQPTQSHQFGNDSNLYLTNLLKWPEGQGALLTVFSSNSDSFPQFDLMLIGSRGTLYHEE